MALSADQVPFILALGCTAIMIAVILWAMRITDGARGAAKKFRDRAGRLEEQLARADSVFGAHPGVILVWEDDALEADGDDISAPQLYGSLAALAGLLRYTDAAIWPILTLMAARQGRAQSSGLLMQRHGALKRARRAAALKRPGR